MHWRDIEEFPAGMLPVYTKLIETHENDDELEAAMRNVWLVSFSKDVAQKIQKSTQLMNGSKPIFIITLTCQHFKALNRCAHTLTQSSLVVYKALYGIFDRSR